MVRLLRNFARIGAYGVLGLLVMEAAARVDDYLRDGAPILMPYTINTIFRASPFGREGVPGARYAKWQMNSLGYRGPEPAQGRVKLLTFGASETFGMYEAANLEYPRRLESLLNQGGNEDYSVINIALPGIRVGRTAYLAHALERTQAKVVVIYPSPANYIGTIEPFCRTADSPAAIKLGLGDYVRLAGKIEQLIKQTVPVSVMTYLREFSIWRETRHSEILPVVPPASVDAFAADLQCVIDVVRANGAEPVLATHATYFGRSLRPEDRAMLVAWRRFYPELEEAGFLDLEQRANAAIRIIAQQQRVALADAEQGIPPGPQYFADFVHFTDAGAERMAELVAQAIVSELPR